MSKISKILILIVLQGLSILIYGQEVFKPKNINIHAGINAGILSGGVGPSFSLNHGIGTNNVFQYETMLFYDSHSGNTFLSGYSQKNWGLGLATGLRINVFPKKNFNPSFMAMGGIMYSSETTSLPYNSKGLSGVLSLCASMSIYQKHMASIGFNIGKNIESLFLKYGYWF
jgi:hypothetical protein